MTITEALAEIKTVGKRIVKKQEFVLDYLYRQEQLKDPLAKDGGADKAIQEAIQSIQDLKHRIVALRAQIAQANADAKLQLLGQKQTISDWLTWKREIAPRRSQFLAEIRNKVQSIRTEAARQGLATVAAEASAKPGDVIVHLNEKWLAEEIEKHEETIGALDGQLSMLNATTHI